MLIDNHNRTINYLRLAVTDRCNLRCKYCMPEKGIDFADSDRLFTIGELSRLSHILVDLGIEKIRITGGEPFVRKDLMTLLRNLTRIGGLKTISVTTNGTLIGDHIDELKRLGIKNVNVSLDAMNREIFEKITRRDGFDTVFGNLTRLISEEFNVKINFVVLKEQNISEIIPMLSLTRHHNVDVRYIEEMPFNGGSKTFHTIEWDYHRILEHIKTAYPDVEKIPSTKP
ncbi:MAG: radical SAM protein, partial [Balneolaceae bacterium]|nr:radical SAM protein [Balneolaceae bacterium]